MAEMNTSTGPGERWGMETPVPTIEAGPSAIGEVALRTREGIADVDGVLAHGDIHRPDLRAYLSSPTPVEAGIMSVGTELVEELGDILPGRTENPGFIPEKLKAHRPGIGEESAWPGFDN